MFQRVPQPPVNRAVRARERLDFRAGLIAALAGAGAYDGFRVAFRGVCVLADAAALPSQIVLRPSATPNRWILQAPPLQTYVLEASPDMVHWLPVLTNGTDLQGQMETPAFSGSAPATFYRARLLP